MIAVIVKMPDSDRVTETGMVTCENCEAQGWDSLAEYYVRSCRTGTQVHLFELCSMCVALLADTLPN